MNKRKLIGLILILAIAPALNGLASGLVPEQCTIGDRPVCYPIVDIGFTFDGAIAIVENSTATVFFDGQPVETGVLSCSNYTGKKRTQGTAVITFDSPLILPKGKSYRLVVPEGVIFREGNPDISNEEIGVEFSVPATIGPARPSIEEGSIVENAKRIGFYFGVETAPIENGKATLLRENVPVREYDCDVSWDWNLGYAGIDFGEKINFENGVRYSILLQEGSISALYRPDIVNEEAVVSFIGGYAEPVKPIQYIWCSLYDHHPTDVLGEVKFFYDLPISLSANPLIQLYIENENLIVKEVVPTVSRENEYWVLTADFEDTPLVSEEGYSIIIPEGTLVTEDGDIVVNQRNVMTIGNSSGVSDIKDSNHNITVLNGMISIDNASNGNHITLYSLDGQVVYSAESNGRTVQIPIKANGIYLLSINGQTYKIAVKQ
jgi:hypothetical protein